MRLGDNPTNKERAAHDAAGAAYRRALDDIEKRQNTFWCYLLMALDSTSLMLIRHDCVDHKGLADGHRAWELLQETFCSNETVTVVILMRHLARLLLKEDEALHNFFIRAQKLSTRRNKQERKNQSRCLMQWNSMVYQSATNISWSKKPSIRLAALFC